MQLRDARICQKPSLDEMSYIKGFRPIKDKEDEYEAIWTSDVSLARIFTRQEIVNLEKGRLEIRLSLCAPFEVDFEWMFPIIRELDLKSSGL